MISSGIFIICVYGLLTTYLDFPAMVKRYCCFVCGKAQGTHLRRHLQSDLEGHGLDDLYSLVASHMYDDADEVELLRRLENVRRTKVDIPAVHLAYVDLKRYFGECHHSELEQLIRDYSKWLVSDEGRACVAEQAGRQVSWLRTYCAGETVNRITNIAWFREGIATREDIMASTKLNYAKYYRKFLEYLDSIGYEYDVGLYDHVVRAIRVIRGVATRHSAAHRPYGAALDRRTKLMYGKLRAMYKRKNRHALGKLGS